MKAYIDVHAGVDKGTHVGEVVTQDDYDNRGPHAHSHRTKPQNSISQARVAAKLWARMNGGYEVVEGPEHF